MSKKHYFPSVSINTLVPRYLSSLVTANPTLTLIESHRIVLSTSHSPSNVALISGGGSGHEPAWAGYVGSGLLSAAVCGDVFASPSMKQILAAIATVRSKEGTILLITNYTGDCLHFGLAKERALQGGVVRRCAVLKATDDVSRGRSETEGVGRRGLAGNVITMKILGAAAAKGCSFDRCVELGTKINEQLATIGSVLDHCHVPGRQNHEELGEDVVVVGAGIHNEPGAQKISPFPTIEELISRLLKLLCDQNDSERAFVKFDVNDDVALLMNNYGGLSNLELGALTHEVLSQLNTQWSISPTKIYNHTFETSLNGPGFSITLFNLTAAAVSCSMSVPEIMNLLAAETDAPAWPNIFSNTSTKVEQKPPQVVDTDQITNLKQEGSFNVDPMILEAAIRLACERAIAAEPDLTNWDMIMGDGDCGEAVKAVSEATIKLLDKGAAKTGSILSVLNTIITAVDDMGGTLGAIIGILLAALSSALRSHSQDYKSASASTDTSHLINILAPCLTQAVSSLKSHTAARVGDRTIMDVLIPFQETLEKERSLADAVIVAERAAEGTANLKPKFGRASYVEKGGQEQRVPDPGAWALAVMLKGLKDGWAKER